MATSRTAKRYSREDAQTIIAKLKTKPFEDLHPLFKEGSLPSFYEIEGDTTGSLLPWDPETPWWVKLQSVILFDSPLGRWTGKRFMTPFNEGKRGKGINLFQNRVLPRRFRFDTSIQKAQADQKPCLVLDYVHLPLSLFSIRDELRKIDDGVFLGQGYAKLPWDKEHFLLVYFAICALQ